MTQKKSILDKGSIREKVSSGIPTSAEKSSDLAFGKKEEESRDSALEFYGAGFDKDNSHKNKGSASVDHAERKHRIGAKDFDKSRPTISNI